MRVSRTDAIVSRLAAAPSAPVLSAIDRLSNVGNGTAVWGAATAGLAATGRRGRTTAAEAAVAYGLASVVSNLVVKRLVDRERPFKLPGTPRKATSAFPSSHAATSFAYATAATASWPAAGAPLVLVAATVAASRVHSRDHRLSEIAAGMVLGAAIGGAVHLVRSRTGARRARRARERPGGDRAARPPRRGRPALSESR